MNHLFTGTAVAALIVAGAGASASVRPELAPWGSANADKDTIPDAYETLLAERFMPVLMLDSGDELRPVSITSFLQCVDLWNNTDRRGAPLLRLGDDAGVQRRGDALQVMNRYMDQNSMAGSRHLRYTKESYRRWSVQTPTMFCRVSDVAGQTSFWSPSPGRKYVMLQYYAFFPWNETSYSGGVGNHEGDWMCVDFNVDITDPRNPSIHSAIYHNHGRQILVRTSSALRYDGARPLVFLEKGTNEPWPNAGGRGFSGFPLAPNVMLNHRFECGDDGWRPNEHKIVREHRGNGPQVRNFVLLNLGERGEPMPGEVQRFVMRYPGTYGGWSKGFNYVFGRYRATCPEGPVFQRTMWDRDFSKYGHNFNVYKLSNGSITPRCG